MTRRIFGRKSALMSALLLGVACGDDAENDKANDARVPVELPDDGDAGIDSDAAEQPGANSLYLIGSAIQTLDESSLLLWTTHALNDDELDPKRAVEITGGSEAFAIGEDVYVGNSEDKTVTRYTLENDELVEDAKISFANEALGPYLGYISTYADAEHAYLLNDVQLEIIEWNPTTMKITNHYDIGAMKREGWGHEYRNGYVRKSDGKFFFTWTYTNARAEFINSFVLGVFDPKTGDLSIHENEECPATAGFGGYFDENEDLYLLADSFGGYTRFGGFDDVKDECILRVKHDEDALDADFQLTVPPILDGRAPWGFYYAGDGLAFTSGIDPAALDDYDSLFELLFAPIHTGWLIDVANGTASEVEGLPPDGVGFASHTVDGRLYVPRTTGQVVIEDIMSLESTLFEIGQDATATPTFSLAGYIQPVLRLR